MVFGKYLLYLLYNNDTGKVPHYEKKLKGQWTKNKILELIKIKIVLHALASTRFLTTKTKVNRKGYRLLEFFPQNSVSFFLVFFLIMFFTQM